MQKKLKHNKTVLSARNDKSNFVYPKLLLKVLSKDMTNHIFTNQN